MILALLSAMRGCTVSFSRLHCLSQTERININSKYVILQGPVVQSIVSLTSSLRGQLVKCFYDFITKSTDIFCCKNERGFCNAKASHIFSTKNIGKFQILTLKILTIH